VQEKEKLLQHGRKTSGLAATRSAKYQKQRHGEVPAFRSQLTRASIRKKLPENRLYSLPIPGMAQIFSIT
jgi:hypothetical protein